MKNLFSSIRSWFVPKDERISEVALLRLEYESRIQHLECVVRRLSAMLEHDKVDVTVSEKTLKEHFDTVISKSVMNWLPNWAEDLEFVKTEDLDDAVESALDNGSAVENACDSWMNNQDWDYNLRDSLDWDAVAEKVAKKMDWSEVISDNDILTTDDIDVDDLMLQSEQMCDDDVMTRADLSDEVCSELKRDWFTQMLKDEVARIFKETLYTARTTEEQNIVNAIDDEIAVKLDALIREELGKKFGEQWDNWYNENTRHCVKVVLGEFLASAYEQTKEGNA